MSLDDLTYPFIWKKIPKKVKERILQPVNVGFFVEESSLERDVFLLTGETMDEEGENILRFYWLVDKEEGVIIDARFQLFGHSTLIGMADLAIDLCIGMHVAQAGRISANLLEKQMHIKRGALPKEFFPYLNLVLSAIDAVVQSSDEIPEEKGYVAPPASIRQLAEEEGDGYPGFENLSYDDKLNVLEDVIKEDIRPYIELDGGGIVIEELSESYELTLSYQGACTSCFSAVGATLSYIQQVLKNKVHQSIKVIPTNLEAGLF